MDRQQETGESRNAVDSFSEAHDPRFAAELKRRLDIAEDRRLTSQRANTEKP